MKKLVLYIACSLDGYIAGPDDDLSFLDSMQVEGEDYGYQAFTSTIDTVIMGRKTYDKVLSFGVPFPHSDKTCYVVSKHKTGKDENVTFYNGNIKALITELKQQGGKDIFCDGGATLVNELMREHLFDRLIVSIIPCILGKGVRLFDDGNSFQKLRLTDCKSFPTGLVQVCYEPA